MQQVVEAAKLLRDGPVELTLRPEELGTVRMTLSPTDGGMTLTIAAERSETLELLRDEAGFDQLAADFREMGFENLNFSFSRQDREAPQDEAAAEAPRDEVRMADPRIGFTSAPKPAGGGGGGLDLRL